MEDQDQVIFIDLVSFWDGPPSYQLLWAEPPWGSESHPSVCTKAGLLTLHADDCAQSKHSSDS